MKIVTLLLSMPLLIIIISYCVDKMRTSDEILLFRKKMRNRDFKIPLISKGTNIPNNIYRIFISTDKEKNIEKYDLALKVTKKSLPHFKTEIYQDWKKIENFILDNYNKEVLDTVNLINKKYMACVSDIVRLLIIYIKGGVYLDIKSSFHEDITSDLDKYKGKLIIGNACDIPFVFRGWTIFPPFGEISNWFFASPRGHPVIREAIIKSLSNIKNCYKNKEDFTSGGICILSMTGPWMLTDVINNTKYRKDIVKVGAFKETLSFLYKKIKKEKIKKISGPSTLAWKGKLIKETVGIDNKKIQSGNHWTKLREPLFVDKQ